MTKKKVDSCIDVCVPCRSAVSPDWTLQRLYAFPYETASCQKGKQTFPRTPSPPARSFPSLTLFNLHKLADDINLGLELVFLQLSQRGAVPHTFLLTQGRNVCSGVARICCEEGQRWKLCHGALTAGSRAGCSSCSMTNSFVTDAVLIERAVSC